MTTKAKTARTPKVGEMMSLTHFVKVTRATKDSISVTDLDNGMAFDVNGDVLIEKMSSADYFSEVQKKNKTELAELLVTLFNRPVTVCFDKDDGETRVMKGRVLSPEPSMGRTHFEDLEIERGKHRLRLVNHRAIHYIITDGVKYELKK